MRGAPNSRRQGDEAVPVSLPRRFLRPRFFVSALLVIGGALLLTPSPELAVDNFVFYFPSSHQMLPFQSSGSGKYLPVMQVLNLVGKVEGIQEKKNSIKIFFDSTQIELKANETKVQVGQSAKMNYELPHPVYLADGQWMVPVDFLTAVLPALIHQPMEYQSGTNRIFIGDVKRASFSVRLDPLANGVRLAVQFTDRVSVHTTSNDGKWIIFLGDRAMEPMEPSYHFQNPYLTGLQFDDSDGLPKLIVSPTSTGLNFYPVLSDDGKVLMADVVKVTASPTQGLPPQTPGGSVIEQPPGAVQGLALPVVVLDAGHGGDDKGGHSKDGILEKDLTQQYALKVRTALLATNKYRVVLTRSGDVNVTAEQRATASNVSSAIYFLSFHAGDLGTTSPRIAIYTFQASNTPDTAPSASPAGGSARPVKSSTFVPWDHVQEARLGQSLQLAQALEKQFTSINGADVILPATAPIRSLRNVNAPAAAIELGRLAPDATAATLADPAFQQKFADSVVQALASFEKGGK